MTPINWKALLINFGNNYFFNTVRDCHTISEELFSLLEHSVVGSPPEIPELSIPRSVFGGEGVDVRPRVSDLLSATDRAIASWLWYS